MFTIQVSDSMGRSPPPLDFLCYGSPTARCDRALNHFIFALFQDGMTHSRNLLEDHGADDSEIIRKGGEEIQVSDGDGEL